MTNNEKLRENILQEHTYKDDGLRLAKRVFYVLADGADMLGKDKLTTYKLAVCMARLLERLNERGLLTDRDIDDLLIAAAFHPGGDIKEDDI